MRRILGSGEVHYYHVVSRVVDRRFIFGAKEKEKFRSLMRDLEGFSGLRVVTYCLMDNHFHLLLELPAAEGARFCSEAQPNEIFARLSFIYDAQEIELIRENYDREQRNGDGHTVLAPYLTRMYNLPSFIRDLKQRFSRWYNGIHERKGTLWEERFRSVLCEGDPGVLATIAAYIDLNPVRAGITMNPATFQWSGFGEASAGGAHAQSALKIVTGAIDWRRSNSASLSASSTYLMLIRAAVTKEDAAGKCAEVGGLSDILRCRVRYFSDGGALGGRSFLQEAFLFNRSYFSTKRTTGARRMRNGAWGNLMCLRDLQSNIVSE